MHVARRILFGFAALVGLLVLVLLIAFGALQTRTGKVWLAREIAQLISDPDFTVAIDGIGGAVPFGMKIARIEIGDRDGIYLTLRDIDLDISPAELLAGRAHIRFLTIGDADMARLTTAPSTRPFTDYLK